MNRIIAIAAAVLILAGGAYVWQSSQTSSPYPTLGAAQAQSTDGEVDSSMVVEMALGDENAPLTVVEYASFTCPHCKHFHRDTFKEFKANYIDTGKVRFIYREVYFDRFGLWASMVARCGGQEKFFGIVDMIYDQQADWTASGDPATIAGALARIGRTAGIAGEDVDACLQDAEKAQGLVAYYEENAGRDGIRSTPSFIIDGELVTGNKSFDEFAALLDAELDS
ncbi:MAG: DsbA family protein [Rhodobacter sp.]|nr:DsbA family protein [Rhodobacter sp.]